MLARHVAFSLVVPVLVFAAVARGADAPAAVDRTDAKATAVAALTAYKAKDWKALAEVSTAEKKKLFADVAAKGQKHPDYQSLVFGWKGTSVGEWDGKTVEAPRYKGTTAWVPFGKTPEGRALVVVLKREGKAWAFDQVDARAKAELEKESDVPPKG